MKRKWRWLLIPLSPIAIVIGFVVGIIRSSVLLQRGPGHIWRSEAMGGSNKGARRLGTKNETLRLQKDEANALAREMTALILDQYLEDGFRIHPRCLPMKCQEILSRIGSHPKDVDLFEESIRDIRDLCHIIPLDWRH